MINGQPWRRPGLAFALAVVLAGATTAAEFPHDLYICVGMTKDFVVTTGKVQGLSGIYRSADRVTIEHVGFNHPRQDSLAADPRNPARFYTVGLNGVLGTSDDGRTWRILTSWDMTEPKDIAIDPHASDHLYISLPDGVGVSLDRGMTWRHMDDGIRRKYTQSIVVDRSQQGRLVAGTELGIYLSEDGAKTWKLMQKSDATFTDVEQSPHDPRCFVAVTQRNGAWESTDGARSWRRIAAVGAEHTLYNIQFDPTNPARLALCGWGCGVLVSEDGGQTWAPCNAGLPNVNVCRVGIDPDISGRLYASPYQEAVYLSDDFGRTWRRGWFEASLVWDFVFVPRH